MGPKGLPRTSTSLRTTGSAALKLCGTGRFTHIVAMPPTTRGDLMVPLQGGDDRLATREASKCTIIFFLIVQILGSHGLDLCVEEYLKDIMRPTLLEAQGKQDEHMSVLISSESLRRLRNPV